MSCLSLSDALEPIGASRHAEPLIEHAPVLTLCEDVGAGRTNHGYEIHILAFFE